MLTFKRVIITTILGALSGLVCMGLASSNPDPSGSVTTGTLLLIVISRTMMGFTIGISAIRMKWWLHGIFIGFIASIPMAIPVFERFPVFIGTFVMGILYGFLIELFTSIVFKAKSPAFAQTA